MKKIKFLGAAVLAASLIFAGCANGSDDEDYSAPAVENPTDSGDGTDQNNNNNGGDTNNNNGENNNGGNNGGNNNGGNTGNNNSGNNGGNNSGNNGGNNSGETETEEFAITLTDATNDYEYADGVYTISLNSAHADNDEWGNQIFIAGVNETAGIANGDKIKTSVTVKADKAITTFFFKNQFHTGDPYPGITKSVSLEADTETTVDIYGNVFDYDDTNTLVIAIRGNEADTTLTLKDVKVEKLGDYAVTSVVVEADADSIAAGETTTLTAKDQFGFEITDATFEITSDNPKSSISGNKLIAGNEAEEITVVAKKGEITSNPLTITITAEKDYAKYWNPSINTEGANAPVDYFSIWYDHNWCGSTVNISDMSATEDGVTLTQTVTGKCWFGTQIWYGVSAASNFTFKVTSSVAGKITINSTVYELEANTAKDITVNNVSGKLAVQLGKEGVMEGDVEVVPYEQLGDCTFTISDFSVTPVTE